MEATTYGYARVSAKDQCEERQLIALREFPVAEANIFLDKVSGKDFNRPAYRRLIRRLRPRDLLVIKSIDRLGRNYEEILEQWQYITKKRQTDIVILDMPLLDTRQRGVRFGRPRKPVPEAFFHLKTAWEAGSISSREAARQLSISQDTFLRWVRGK